MRMADYLHPECGYLASDKYEIISIRSETNVNRYAALFLYFWQKQKVLTIFCFNSKNSNKKNCNVKKKITKML